MVNETKAPEIFDVEKMAENLGVTIFDFKIGLNIAIEDIKTLDEACMIHKYTRDCPMSKKISLYICNELGLKALEKAKTLSQVKEVHKKIPLGVEAEKMACEKSNKLGLKALEKVKTFDEARDLFNNTIPGTEANDLSIEKFLSFFEK